MPREKNVRRRSRAEIRVADGAGGMSLVKDLRFDNDEWPIQLEIEGNTADKWLFRFAAECRKRGWQNSGLTQIDAYENSGTITVRHEASEIVSVVWERRKEGTLKIKARPKTALSTELIQAVEAAHCAGTMERLYRRGLLHFNGLPWRGHLWLSDSLRLGPPSEQDESALIGPRYIVVDAQVDGAD